MKYFYGCEKDVRDDRDLMFAPRPIPVPVKMDYRAQCPPVMDQGELGSCTANGITGGLRFCQIVQGAPDFPMSRLQLYYDEREREGTVGRDAGAQIRDGIKCAARNGVGHEDLWPYDISKFTYKPFQQVYTDAKKYQALEYRRVPCVTEMVKQALARKFPVIIGVMLFSSFESDRVRKTGIVPMPDPEKEKIVGGHCMYCAGHEIAGKGTFIVRNSWSEEWGDNGDCYFPENYFDYFGNDFWTITKAEIGT